MVKKSKQINQWWILRDSSGEKSTSFTMMWSSFLILSLWLILNIAEIPHLREFSSEVALAWMTPLITLYFSRQYTKATSPSPTLDASIIDSEPSESQSHPDPSKS